MKIGLYTPSWPGGAMANGITTAAAHLATGLREIDRAATIVALECEDPDAGVFTLPSQRAPTLTERVRLRLGHSRLQVRFFSDQIARAAKRAAAEAGMDVFLMEETQGLCGMVQRQTGIPVIAVLHGPWMLLNGQMGSAERDDPLNIGRIKRERQGLQTCAGICAPSRSVLDSVVEAYGLGETPHAVIPNAIPTGPATDHSTLDAEQRRSLLYVGRFDNLKGGDTLLDGFTRLITGGCDARLTIAGPDRGLETDGQPRSLESLIAGLPETVRQRVTWLGPLSKAEIETERRHHAVGLVTSRFETFGYTVLESMAVGAATIATDVGGIPEILSHESDGLLIPPNDPQALAAACTRLLENPDLAASLGARAHQTVQDLYAPAEIARQWVAFLEPVVRDWKGAA